MYPVPPLCSCCEQQHVGVIGPNSRGFDTHIACAFERPLSETTCVNCGQCIVACPTGALQEKDECQKVLDAINDPEKIVIVQDRAVYPRHSGRMFRYAHRHQRGGQNGCRSAPPGL